MLGSAIKPILEANVLINQLYLREFPQTPLLYRSGVRYRNEPQGQGFEDFALIPAIYARGWGDCDDLAPARVAELRERFSEPANISILWKRMGGGGKLFHIVVRRADGSIEDPSKLLGMKG
jgi:hypothetical protein